MLISASVVGIRPGLRVLHAKIDALPDRLLSKEEVERIGREAVSAQAASVPYYGAPGMLILIGGILVSFSARPRLDSKNSI